MPRQFPRFRTVALFGFFWGCIGYVLGTATLLGPVRWVTDILRAREAGDGAERLAVLVLILLLAIASGAVAAFCTRRVVHAESGVPRFGLPALALIMACGCVWVWMTPSLMRGGTDEVTIASASPASQAASIDSPAAPDSTPSAVPPNSDNSADGSTGNKVGQGEAVAKGGSHFTFGPYPEEDRLAELKQDDFDGVVSLLHPAVVPFEPKLLAEERTAAAKVGIQMHHMPMLPWVGDNEESLERLRELASKPGRYYVHCYLGRDRVRMAQAVVARAIEATDAASRVTFAVQLEDKGSLADKKSFERGPIVKLAEDAYLTPFPTDEEFASRIVSAEWGAIVSLLDSGIAENREWIEKERKMLKRYGLELIEMPISVRGYDAAAVLELTEEIRRLPRPLLVHDFLAAASGKAPGAEAFLAAWQTGLPPVPASLFDAQVLAANVVVGPRPQFRRVGRKGISQVLYIGAAEPATDRAEAEAAGLQFSVVDPVAQPDWMERLSQDGPWYIYGVDAAEVSEKLSRRGDA